ncbi:MAG: hypothetical protein KKA73_19870 [Chloroflexi bacterium]|nr:hypothetical protein [Chloroflexota bacterium]MBU1749947.1 hypothetical protein [Chloroflexota bacterium]
MTDLAVQDLQTEAIWGIVAQELQLSEQDLLKQGIRSLLDRRLREVKTQIFEIQSCYGVSSVQDMETRYREGTLEEADSWRDWQRLDHLEYKRDRLLQLAEALR